MVIDAGEKKETPTTDEKMTDEDNKANEETKEPVNDDADSAKLD